MTLSITENLINDEFKLYPNPFEDELNIKISLHKIETISKIRLVDITGKIMYEEEDISSIMSLKFNPSLSNGLYFIQVVNTNNHVINTRKVIKK